MKSFRIVISLTLLTALFVFTAPGWAQCSEGDPDCPIVPPQSRQVSENSNTGETESEALEYGELNSLKVQFPMPLPGKVDAASWTNSETPNDATNHSASFDTLILPVYYQDSQDVSCGVQALGMALAGIEGSAPKPNALMDFLSGEGMLYDFGTGVEELAHAAQSFGYKGSLPFHGASIKTLQAQLDQGHPVVVTLGSNGVGEPGHFVTLTGISPDGEWVAYNDPTLGKQVVSRAKFERMWSLQSNSGVSIAAEPPTVAGTAIDYAPYIAIAAGIMALISTSPLGRMRTGIGGRISRGSSRRYSYRPRSKPKPRRSYRPKPKPRRRPKPKPRPKRRVRSKPKPRPRPRPKPKPKPKPVRVPAVAKTTPPAPKKKKGLFGRVASAVSRAASSVTRTVRNTASRAASAVSSAASRVRNSVSSAARRATSAVRNTASRITGRSTQRDTLTSRRRSTSAAGAGSFGATTWRSQPAPPAPKKGFFDRVASAVTNAASAVNNAVSDVRNRVSSTIDRVVSTVRQTKDNVQSAVTSAASRVRRAFNSSSNRANTANGEPAPSFTPEPEEDPQATPTPITTQTPSPTPPNTSKYGTAVPDGWTPTPSPTPDPTGTPTFEEMLTNYHRIQNARLEQRNNDIESCYYQDNIKICLMQIMGEMYREMDVNLPELIDTPANNEINANEILADLLPSTIMNWNEPINSNFLVLLELDALQQSNYEPLYLESLKAVHTDEYNRAELIFEEERRMNGIFKDVLTDYLYESPLEFSITGQE